MSEGLSSPRTDRARTLWIIGGVVAFVAAVTLLAAVELRAWRLAPRSIVNPLFRWHDGLIAVQWALLLPCALRLSRITTQRSSSGQLAAAVAQARAT